MNKLLQFGSAGLLALVAAASILSLAIAAPAGDEPAPKNCYKAFCLVSFF